MYKDFAQRCYFQQHLGFQCVDSGPVEGLLGLDIESVVFWRLRKSTLWPIEEHCANYTEDDLFDMIEFLYDCVSKPIDGWYHDYGECGWHYGNYDASAGRLEFCGKANSLLPDYQNGFELSDVGEILEASQPWVAPLANAQLPRYDPDNVEIRVEAAILKFRRRGNSLDDKRDAVRDLADVLEFLRPKLKDAFDSQDERDLFNIANNYAIRHHDPRQKRNYDPAIWCSWMFYVYLATIHAAVRLIIRNEGAT